MIFPVTVINNTTPQVSVTVSDSGSPSVTYAQIKNSLGLDIYNVEAFYLQSNILQQLIGTIQFNRYDSTGEQAYKTITTTVDPYQKSKSLIKDLTPFGGFFILNGQSDFTTTLLPGVSLKVTLYTKRISNSFGMNLNSFRIMEQVFRKPDFYGLGDLTQVNKTNETVAKDVTKTTSFTGPEKDDSAVMALSFATIVVALIYIHYAVR